MAVISPEQRTEWTRLTDRLSAEYAGYDVTIEVLDPEVGDNPMVERLPFDGVTYDPKDDVLVAAVGGKDQRYPVVLRHLIHHPRELVVDQNPQGAALKVTDESGTTTLVSLLRPRDDEAPQQKLPGDVECQRLPSGHQPAPGTAATGIGRVSHGHRPSLRMSQAATAIGRNVSR